MAKSTLTSNTESPSIDTDLDIVGSVYADESDDVEVVNGAVIGEAVVCGTVSQFIVSEGGSSANIVFLPTPSDFPGVGDENSIYIVESTGEICRWDSESHKYPALGSQLSAIVKIVVGMSPGFSKDTLTISQIILRNMTAAEWENLNPVLASAEIGIEKGTGKFKIGDGTHTWSELICAYVTPTDYATGIKGGTVVSSNAINKITVGVDGTMTINTIDGSKITSVLSVDVIPALSWNKITSGLPTTLAGYGITDATPSSHIGSGGTAHANATTSKAGFQSASDKIKLDGIEAGAEVNNISDTNATDLTDGADTILHYHSTDRNRANHTGTQTSSTISDFASAALLAAPAETAVSLGKLINGSTAKTTPVTTDMFAIMDSVASNVAKKISYADLLIALGTSLASTFAPTSHTQTASTITDFASAVSGNTNVSANTAARHTHSNKNILDNTTAPYTTTEQAKLSGIAAGAEVNINADWDASSGDAQILHKPTSISGYGIIDAYTKTEVNHLIQAAGGGDMMKAVFATNEKITSGYVDKAIMADNAITVNNLTVEAAVPADALFMTSTERINLTDLTGNANTALHYHDTDRDRANHTGTQAASTIVEDTDHNFVTATERTSILHDNRTVIDGLSESNGKLMYNGTAVSESPANLTMTALTLGPYALQYNAASAKLEITHTA